MNTLLSFLLASSCAADPQPALGLEGPRWQRGDEHIFSGEILETNDTLENRFKKKYALEVALFVLEVKNGVADVALLTVVRSMADPAIARALISVSGKPTDTSAQADRIRLDLIRVDARGRISLLTPPMDLPLNLAKAESARLADLSLDLPQLPETGFIFSVPSERLVIGSRWSTPGGTRPPIDWLIDGEVSLLSRRAVMVRMEQSSEYYDKPKLSQLAWKRSEQAAISIVDGIALSVRREVVRRHGAEQVGSLITEYRWKELNRHLGGRYEQRRRIIEQAWLANAQLEAAIRQPGPFPRAEFQERSAKLKRYLQDHSEWDVYRQSLESTIRRLEAIARGEVPYLAPKVTISIQTAELIRVDRPAPDFVITDVDRPEKSFRLTKDLTKPVVMLFFKPGSQTSADTLLVAEALHRRFGDRAIVLPLAVAAEPVLASEQRQQLKLSVPVWDGRELKKKYQVTAYPLLLVLDSAKRIRWIFDAGIGPEIGFLTRQQLEKCLTEPLHPSGGR